MITLLMRCRNIILNAKLGSLQYVGKADENVAFANESGFDENAMIISAFRWKINNSVKWYYRA